MSNKEYLDYEGLGYLADHISMRDGKKIKKKLRAGDTSLTIEDSVIKSTSLIDIYSDVYGVYATSVVQSNGSLTITFPAQANDLNVIVIVRDGRGGGGLEPTGDAIESDVLYNKVFSNADGIDKVGTMPNIGAVSPSPLIPGGSYTVPEGYHNGNGVVEAASNTGTYSPTTRNAALDMGADNLNRYVDTTGVPNTNSGTYTFASGDTGGTKDLGETNTYRYVNASNVYNKGKADGVLSSNFKYALLTQNNSGTVSYINLETGAYIKQSIAYNTSVTIDGHVLSLSYSNGYNLSISSGSISGYRFTGPGISFTALKNFKSGNIGVIAQVIFNFD